MKILRLTTLALFPLLVAACEAEEDRIEGMAEDIAAAPDVDAGQSMVGDTVSGAPEGMQATVVMNEVGGSGVTGEAVVMPGQAAGSTSVRVTLTAGGGQGGVHQGHIHQGRCDSIGSVVAPLQPIDASSGSGTATSRATVDPMSVMDGNHVVVYHQPGGQPGAPAVCGDIPGHEM